jgi:hypothetical protein
MKAIEISAEQATAIRELIGRSKIAYAAFDQIQSQIKTCYLNLAGPIGRGEIAALRKYSDRIEVVPRHEYLDDVNKERWY